MGVGSAAALAVSPHRSVARSTPAAPRSRGSGSELRGIVAPRIDQDEMDPAARAPPRRCTGYRRRTGAPRRDPEPVEREIEDAAIRLLDADDVRVDHELDVVEEIAVAQVHRAPPVRVRHDRAPQAQARRARRARRESLPSDASTDRVSRWARHEARRDRGHERCGNAGGLERCRRSRRRCRPSRRAAATADRDAAGPCSRRSGGVPWSRRGAARRP